MCISTSKPSNLIEFDQNEKLGSCPKIELIILTNTKKRKLYKIRFLFGKYFGDNNMRNKYNKTINCTDRINSKVLGKIKGELKYVERIKGTRNNTPALVMYINLSKDSIFSLLSGKIIILL